MGNSTISMAIFNSFLYVYQRVTWFNHDSKGFQNCFLDGLTMKTWACKINRSSASFGIEDLPVMRKIMTYPNLVNLLKYVFSKTMKQRMILLIHSLWPCLAPRTARMRAHPVVWRGGSLLQRRISAIMGMGITIP